MLEVLERTECSSLTFVELLNHGNDDNTVRDAARVSHDACAKSASPTLLNYLAKNDHFTPYGHVRFRGHFTGIDENKLLEWSADRLPGWEFGRDFGGARGAWWIEGSLYNWLGVGEDLPPINCLGRLLAHLCASGCEDSVNAFVFNDWKEDRAIEKSDDIVPGSWLTFRIHAPVIVLRQMMRSNHGIVYNEVSRRYIVSDPSFFEPEVWRRKPKKGIKQGSGEGEVRTFLSSQMNEWIKDRGFFPFAVDLSTAYRDWIQTAGELYNLFIGAGVAPELARSLLPVSHYSEVWMTASPAAIRRIVGLRSNRGANNHAQKEIEEVSRAIESAVEGRIEL